MCLIVSGMCLIVNLGQKQGPGMCLIVKIPLRYVLDRKWKARRASESCVTDRKSYVLQIYDQAHGLRVRIFNHLAIPYDQAHGIYDQAHGLRSSEMSCKWLFLQSLEENTRFSRDPSIWYGFMV